MALVCALLFFGVSPQTAAAQEPEAEGPTAMLGAELSFGDIAEDNFLAIDLKGRFLLPLPRLGCDSEKKSRCKTNLDIGLQAPLRLTLLDRPPEQNTTLLRSQDWDEVSDWLRILRFIRYGDGQGPVSVQVGQLGSVSLGHGVVMRDYFNVLTPDQQQVGAKLRVSFPAFQATAMLDNVIEPHIMGANITLRPAALLDQTGVFSGFSLGITALTDLGAPSELPNVAANTPDPGPNAVTTFLGAELDAWVFLSDFVDLGLYGDYVEHIDVGSGVHLGFRSLWKPGLSLNINLEGEYILANKQYTPRYMGPAYEIERFQFQGFGSLVQAPKRKIAASLMHDRMTGWYGALGIAMPTRNWSMRLAYGSNSVSESDQLTFWIKARLLPMWQFGVYYHHNAFESLEQALSLDGALLSGESRLDLNSWLYAHARYDRRWQWQREQGYVSINSWFVGLGANVAWLLDW